MNMPFPSRGQVEFTRSCYPPGTRIVLNSMNDPYAPVESGMEATRNLCAQIPVTLHDRVRQEREALGQSLSEYVTQILKEHFEGGKTTMAAIKTLAFQIPEELDLRIKNYLAAEKERTGKKVSQREFIVGLIEQALDAYEAADTTAE